jgi:glycine/D-amino acid oxidase-like deaminating enzyme
VRRNGRNGTCAPTGTVLADKLVLATNGYTGDVWPGLRRSVVPVFSAIARRRTVTTRADAVGAYELGRVTVYYGSDRANRLLMGGTACSGTSGAGRAALPDLLR